MWLLHRFLLMQKHTSYHQLLAQTNLLIGRQLELVHMGGSE